MRLVAVLEALAGGVELGPVAGREQHHFAQRRIAGQRRHGFAEIAGGEREPLAQVDGRGVMADAEDQEPHQSKAWLVGTRYATGSRLTRMMTKPTADSQAVRLPLQPSMVRARIWKA